MGNSRKNLLKYGYVALATFVATKLVGGVCLLFSAMLIASLILTGKVLFELLDQEDITGKRVFIAIAIVLLMMGIGVYHKLNCHKSLSLANQEPVVECEDETDDCTPVQNPVAPQEPAAPTDTTKTKTNKPSRTLTSDEEIKYKNTLRETINENNAEADEKRSEVGLENESNKKQKEDIKKAQEEGKTVNQQEDGIVTTKTDKKPEDNKEEEKPIVIDTDKANEEAKKLVSNEENKDQKPSEKLEEKEDKLHQDGDDKLKELEKLTSKNEVKKPVKEEKVTTPVAEETKVEKPVVETKTETVEIENEPEVETKVEEVEETETKKVETVKPEVTEAQEVKDTEIKVTAIDGYEGFVGSDIQFKISGDNVVVDGIEGTNSNFNKETGMLTINSAEATVVTVELTNSTSNVTFDVTINGIVK